MDLSDSKQRGDDLSRYVRVNLDLQEDPPKIDDKSQLAELQALSTRLLKTDYQNLIETIAHKLVASTFYFEKESVTHNVVSGKWICSGMKSTL